MFNKLSFKAKEDLYYYAIGIFLKKNLKIPSGETKLIFNKRCFFILLEKGMLFNIASSFSYLGHDYDVKKCYLNLVVNFNIKTFYDVGANHGQHSILMMSQGINCFAFEPNINCPESLISTASYNKFTNYKLIKNAVGEKSGKLYLNFNPKETWNGKVSNKVSHIKNETSMEVSIITLDSFFLENQTPQLIKIDTEGYKINVLKGAITLIKNSRPMIIFETLSNDILTFFKSYSYKVLNIKKNYNEVTSEIEGFQNFLACPEEKYIYFSSKF